MNRICIVGRLTKQPELRVTPNGVPVANFTVAVNRRAKDEVDFIDCVAFKQSAEFITAYGDKGRVVSVEGRLQSRKWEDRDGNKRTSWEIAVDNVELWDKRQEA
jgi:single-strand DNA-binding protein